VSAIPVAFSLDQVVYGFTSDISAFGNNLKQLADGWWVIYGGDINQDDIIDSGDMIPVDNQNRIFGTGYLPEDANGDGLVDSGDMIMVDNNASQFIISITP